MAREIGYYWVYGNKCFEVKKWDIYYWDGFSFWKDNDDFTEDVFERIEDTEISRPVY